MGATNIPLGRSKVFLFSAGQHDPGFVVDATAVGTDPRPVPAPVTSTVPGITQWFVGNATDAEMLGTTAPEHLAIHFLTLGATFDGVDVEACGVRVADEGVDRYYVSLETLVGNVYSDDARGVLPGIRGGIVGTIDKGDYFNFTTVLATSRTP